MQNPKGSLHGENSIFIKIPNEKGYASYYTKITKMIDVSSYLGLNGSDPSADFI
jgi:hypothetical protein